MPSAVSKTWGSSRPSQRTLNYCLTDEVPFSAALISVRLYLIVLRRQIDLAAVVGPRTELHFTELVVKWKPLDVDGTGRDEETERNPVHRSVRIDDNVRRELAVYVFVSAAEPKTSSIAIYFISAARIIRPIGVLHTGYHTKRVILQKNLWNMKLRATFV